VLDEIVRQGARQMLAAALQAEVAAYIEVHRAVHNRSPARSRAGGTDAPMKSHAEASHGSSALTS